MTDIAVAAGITLRVAAPPEARDEAEGALPKIDVSAVPGARVVVRRGFASEDLTVRVACVIAPSDRWAPGLEELVLGRATGLAQASVGAPIERWEAGPITTIGARFEQRVTGRTGGREVAAIEHTLGFVGADHEVLLCSIACASRGDLGASKAVGAGDSRASGVPGGSAGACEAVLAGSKVEGSLRGPPPPSLLVRAVLATAERPFEAAGLFAVIGALVVVGLLWTRPRVPGRRRWP